MSPDQVLERTQWDLFWVPPDARVVDRPELLYVCCDRPVGYLNSCLRIRGAQSDLPGLVAELSAAHAGVLSKVQVNPQCQSTALERALTAAGYAAGDRHHGMSIAVDDHARTPPDDLVVRPVRDRQGLADWDHAHGLAFGRPLDRDPGETALELARAVPGNRVQRFVAYDRSTGEPLASSAMTAFDDLGFGMCWGGGTVPSGRGRGAYTALVSARIAMARTLGLARIGLYARVGTSAPIVSRQGFERHGVMTFWERGVLG